MSLIITRDPLKSFLENINENKNVLFTGSRRFDLCWYQHNYDIDYDYVITKEDWLAIDKSLVLIYTDSSEKYKNFIFASYHLYYEERNYNIIVVNTMEEFRSWEYVFLKIIEESRCRGIYINKDRRVALFETLKSNYMNYKAEREY